MEILNKVFENLNSDVSWIRERSIFVTIHGSVAYGLSTPESDIDLRGVCTAPKEYLLGFNKHFDQLVKNDPDITIFNIKKFFKLCSENNPNCLELLFVDPKHHLLVTDIGKELLDNRDRFLSKLVKERYIGYAKAQAHRIKNHRRWLLNPMTEKPTRQSLGLSEKPVIDKNQFDIVKSVINSKLESWNPDFEEFSPSQKIYLQGKVSDILSEMEITKDEKWASAARTIGLNENLIFLLKKEKEYENKLEDWDSYQKWKKNRNPKRAALEAKFGFDLKHGTQLVRLLRLGKEILETGKVQVTRTDDREELMAIKTGSWTFDQLIDYSDKIESEMKISYVNSKLPNQPNIKYLDELCIRLIEKSYK